MNLLQTISRRGAIAQMAKEAVKLASGVCVVNVLVKPSKAEAATRLQKELLLLSKPPAAPAAVASWTYDATQFNGSNQQMARGGALTGLADGQVGTISAWVKHEDTGSNNYYVFNNNATRFYFRKGTTHVLRIVGKDSSGTTILDLLGNTALTAGSWYHFLCSWDLSTAGRRWMYLNGGSDINANTFTVGTTINYLDASTPNWFAGSTGGGSYWKGGLSELWFDTSYTAYSAGFLAKFYSGSKPVNLGADGSLPTGTAPLVYFHSNSGSSFNGTNGGSGGGFTVANGPLSVCADKP